jgi:hypothetical protein
MQAFFAEVLMGVALVAGSAVFVFAPVWLWLRKHA